MSLKSDPTCSYLVPTSVFQKPLCTTALFLRYYLYTYKDIY